MRSPRSESPSTGKPIERPAVVLSWPYAPADSAASPVPVPALQGLSVRGAALALHRRGLRMRLEGIGRITRSAPAAGEPVRPGASVAVWAE